MPKPLMVVIVVLLIAAAYLSTCWYLAWKLSAAERKHATRTPADLGFSNAERVFFETEDGLRLEGWLVPSAGERAIILVHGIYSHAWDGHAADLVGAYAKAGFDVFLFDLRGQGRSAGRLGLAWLEHRDIQGAVNMLLRRGFKPGSIGLHGTSYGAAAAVVATAQIPEIGALVADSAFADLRDVMLGETARQTSLPLAMVLPLGPGLRMMARLQFGLDLLTISPEKWIGVIERRPILLIHGDRDSVIPLEAARRLHAAAPAGTELWILTGRDHTEDMRLAPDYAEASPMREEFLDRVVRFLDHSLPPHEPDGAEVPHDTSGMRVPQDQAIGFREGT